MTRRAPLIHRLIKRRAERQPERVNVIYRSRQAANRTGWLDLAIGGVIAAVMLGAFWMLGGVR